MSKTTVYSFSSAPRVVLARSMWSPRKEEEDAVDDVDRRPQRYSNLMYERRVVRGLTCAKPGPPAHLEPEPEAKKPRKRPKRSWRGSRWSLRNFRSVSISVAAVPLSYPEMLEQLYPVEEEVLREMADEEIQTDEFLDRPPIPDYLPVKTGVDNWAQVYNEELFDFDFEVRPILDLLIAKTVDVAMHEVSEEDELADIRVTLRRFQEMREADEALKASLEEKDRRNGIEKQYRLFKRSDAVEKERQLTCKIAASAYTQCCHQDLRSNVFDLLTSKGFLYDPLNRELELNILDHVEHALEGEINEQHFHRRFLDFVLWEVLKDRENAYEALERKQAQLSSTDQTEEEQMEEEGESSGTLSETESNMTHG